MLHEPFRAWQRFRQGLRFTKDDDAVTARQSGYHAHEAHSTAGARLLDDGADMEALGRTSREAGRVTPVDEVAPRFSMTVSPCVNAAAIPHNSCSRHATSTAAKVEEAARRPAPTLTRGACGRRIAGFSGFGVARACVQPLVLTLQ